MNFKGREANLRIIDQSDQQVFLLTERFLRERTYDLDALAWAIALGPRQVAERDAVRRLVDYPQKSMSEPYLSAWRVVVESWKTIEFDESLKAVQIAEDVRAGLNPGLLIDDLVRLVSPQMKVEVTGKLARPSSRPPKSLSDLVRVTLAADDLVRLSMVGFDTVTDVKVFADLTDRLHAALCHSLAWSDRLGQPVDEITNWIKRVYHHEVPDEDGGERVRDPDEFQRGFGAIVKLLSESLSSLAALDVQAAKRRVAKLEVETHPIMLRLWTAAAFNSDLVDAETLGQHLTALTPDQIWDTDSYPEIAELRTRRFGELATHHRIAIERALRKRPARSFYRRGLEPGLRERLRTQAACEQLQLIVATGSTLSDVSMRWLATNALGDDVGDRRVKDAEDNELYFPERGQSPYSMSEGSTLLGRLNKDLAGRVYIEGRRALDFVEVNLRRIFDLVRAERDPSQYPRVWSAVAASARDVLHPVENTEGRKSVGSRELLAELCDLSEDAIATGAEGICYWMAESAKSLGNEAKFRTLWLFAWKGASALANAPEEMSEGDHLFDHNDSDDLASDSLNSPVGRLMSAFLAMLPNLTETPAPFSQPELAEIRKVIIESDGYARLQGLHRLLIELPYMRRADEEWTNHNLLEPLAAGHSSDNLLWDAISRIGLLPDSALSIIEKEMCRAARDQALTSEVRARLGERIVLPVVYALANGREPVVTFPNLQQMLRLGDARLRSSCAGALVNAIQGTKQAKGAFYNSALRPILLNGWPRDRGAVSPSVSSSLASLPAATESEIVQACADIDDLLVPFDAWTLRAYSLLGTRSGETSSLKYPTNAAEARSLLRLIDQTVGDAEGAVVPHDLGLFVQRVAEISPQLTHSPSFSRLSALARR